MDTTHHYPLTASINAYTDFNSAKSLYDTDTTRSFYNINSEGITIGMGEFTKYITFNATDFNNIVFNKWPCGKSSPEASISLGNLNSLISLFNNLDGDTIDFNKNVVFRGTAEFTTNTYFANPETIIFKKADGGENVTLPDYISNHPWYFSKPIHFENDVYMGENVYIGDTTLKAYINQVSQIKYIILKSTEEPKPEEMEEGIIYLVPDKLPDTEYYTEYIKILVGDVYKVEKIGTTQTDISGLLKRDESNQYPSFPGTEYNGEPGIKFGDTFYSFRGLEFDGNKKPGKFIKIDGGNDMPMVPGHEGEPGIEFNGIFYSFANLVQQYSGPEFDVTGEGATPEIGKQDGKLLICTTNGASSITINPKNQNKYFVLDAVVLDDNSTPWENELTINNSGIHIKFNDNNAEKGAWLYIKTLDIEPALSNDCVNNSVIFLRKTTATQIPTTPTGNIEFEYVYNGVTKPVSDSKITLATQYDTLIVQSSYYEIINAHIASANGLVNVTGMQNGKVYMDIDYTKTGTDYLVLKCLFIDSENKNAFTTDRVLRISKEN